MKKAEIDGNSTDINKLNAKNTSLSQRKVSTDNLIENFAEDGWYQVRNYSLFEAKIGLKLTIFRIRKLVNGVMILG